MKSRMMTGVNFKDDSMSEESQLITSSLRMIDQVVCGCYNLNKRKSDVEFEPNIVLYVGDEEMNALLNLYRDNCELTNGSDYRYFPNNFKYRGFHVVRVCEKYHLRAVCINH